MRTQDFAIFFVDLRCNTGFYVADWCRSIIALSTTILKKTKKNILNKKEQLFQSSPFDLRDCMRTQRQTYTSFSSYQKTKVMTEDGRI